VRLWARPRHSVVVRTAVYYNICLGGTGSRLVRTRGGGGRWEARPRCLCLGQHERDAAIELHLPGVRYACNGHAGMAAWAHGTDRPLHSRCHRLGQDRPETTAKGPAPRHASPCVGRLSRCQLLSFWPGKARGKGTNWRKNWSRRRCGGGGAARTTIGVRVHGSSHLFGCSGTAVGNEEGVGFRPFTWTRRAQQGARRNPVDGWLASLRHAAAAPRRVAGAATATRPDPAAAACRMRHNPGFAVAAVLGSLGTRRRRLMAWWPAQIAVADADVSGPLRQRWIYWVLLGPNRHEKPKPANLGFHSRVINNSLAPIFPELWALKRHQCSPSWTHPYFFTKVCFVRESVPHFICPGPTHLTQFLVG